MKIFVPAAAVAALFPTIALADVLIDNVQGVTLDDKGRIERFTGVVVGDDGIVTDVLEKKDKRPKKVDYRYDGKGAVLVPGMIDSHAHVMAIGFAQMTLDLSGTSSLEEALAAIRAYAAAHPDRPWITGGGWNQEKWGLGRFPTAADLDSVVPDRPVWLDRVDGHAGWANSAAMRSAGVTAQAADPQGGHIERVSGSREPAGVFVDAAMPLVSARVPAPRPIDEDTAFAKAQLSLLENGVTTVADMATTIQSWQTYRRAGDAGKLRIRIAAYADGTDAMQLIGGPGPTPWLYDGRLKLAGVKLYIDGALGSRGAWLKQPYADAPDSRGLPVMTDTRLGNLMSRAAIDDFQIAVHAIGDKGNSSVLSAIEELSQTYKGDRRWRIEHAQIVDPADIPRFGTDGVIASMQPQHQTSDRTMAEARLGPQRLAGAYAWKSIAATGSVLAFGSDAPVEPAQPFLGIAAATTRQGPDGQPAGGWQPQERLTREEALAGYTTGGAFALFSEKTLGRIAKGFRADFLLVDRDPLTVTPDALRQTQVMETWIGGVRAWKRGDGAGQTAPDGR